MMLPIVFSSLETGAPVLNNAAGALIGVLDACLVTGFNVKNIASLSVSGGVATVTTQAAHGYLAAGMNTAGGSTTATGNRVTLSGFAESALNADFAVLSVPSSTTFTFAVTLPDGSYTGTGLQAKRTPLGWAKAHSGTNKAIYKSTDIKAYGQMLRVDDSAGGIEARVIGVESATGIDNYTGPFPTAAQLNGGAYWPRGLDNSNAKNWVIIGDERGFYGILPCSFGYWAYQPASCQSVWFGDIISYRAGEAFGTLLAGSATSNVDPSEEKNILVYMSSMGRITGTGAWLARQHTGITQSVRASTVSTGVVDGAIGSISTAPAYPSPVDNGALMIELVLVQEYAGSANNNPIRGQLPGAVALLCRTDQLPDVVNGQTLIDGDASIIAFKKTFAAYDLAGNLAVKLHQPWR